MPLKAIIYDNGNVEIARNWQIDYGDYVIEVPIGFISDGNSVPWLFTRMVPKFGRNTLAGIVHDWLYAEPYVYGKGGKVWHVDRKFADRVRLNICVKCCVPWYQRTLSYIFLRLFGGFAWRRHRKEDKR